MKLKWCQYFQAHLVPERVWFVTAVLRGCEHVAFDRTIDPQKSIFEFFVPEDRLEIFLPLMRYFQDKQLVQNFVELPNRLS